MKESGKKALFILRIAMGWLFLYAGITKVFDPEWSAEGFLSGASSLSGFYNWLALPSNIGWVNFLNEWGLTLIGLALIFGVFTRYASYAGILLMLLYYFPALDFPHVGSHSFIIDDHIIYALVFVILIVFDAGKYWGLDAKLKDYLS